MWKPRGVVVVVIGGGLGLGCLGWGEEVRWVSSRRVSSVLISVCLLMVSVSWGLGPGAVVQSGQRWGVDVG